jgi:hypothetical protein
MHPQNADELCRYLQENPVVSVFLPKGHSLYVFKKWDGDKIEFATQDERIVTLHLDGGPIEYHPDGFIRRVGRFVGQFLYTGNKPWKLPCQLKTPA